jgi:acetyl esterase/lipase
MGESAGGNLAINVAMAARDQTFRPPVHAVVVYTVTRVTVRNAACMKTSALR